MMIGKRSRFFHDVVFALSLWLLAIGVEAQNAQSPALGPQPTVTQETTPAPAIQIPIPPAPDGEKLSALLTSGKFEQLDKELGGYQEAYRAGLIGDEEAVSALGVLPRTDPDLRPLYDRWVATKPDSYVAHLARARFLINLGVLARGSDYIRDTPQVQIDDMRRLLGEASAELERAIQLEARPVLAYSSLILIGQYVGTTEERAKFLEQALALDPRAYGPRVLYLQSLRPQWGGSIEWMEAALAAWKPSLQEAQLARLDRLIQEAKWRRAFATADSLFDSGRYKDAIAQYDELLAKYPVARGLAMRGAAYQALGEHKRALEDFDRALAIDPDGYCGCSTRTSRAASYLIIGAFEKALPDLKFAADNNDHWATRELALIYTYGRYGVKRDDIVARRWCERSAKQGDGFSMYCFGSLLYEGRGGPQNMTAAAPWFKGAAERGIADAQADYAYMLWHGQGVEMSRLQAIRWWFAAALQGNTRAMSQLVWHATGLDFLMSLIMPQ